MRGRGQTGNTKYVKQMNREGILFQLKQKQMSRADLAKETELSRPCVSALVDEMINEGLICEVGIGASKGGRKPMLLEYNTQAFGVVGAVFEGSTIRMALADLKGELLAQYEATLPQPTSGEMAIKGLEIGLEQLLTQTHYDKSRLLGMGVGLPGVTQKRSGTISYSPSTGWMGLPVQQEIEARLGLPVTIDNDVNMMTLGEYYQGAGKEMSTLVNMYVGTGIGAGIIINGQFYRGSHEASGEIGYMMVGPSNNPRPGDYGVFESNYAVPAIYARASQLLPSIQEGVSIVEQLVVHAQQGTEGVQELLDELYRKWAYGIANIISVLDPELLILSGEMLYIKEQGVQTIREWLSNWVPVVPVIRLASLGDQAGIAGAVHSVLESFPNKSATI
ncbi:ROK family transcriptional regulator [Paenibacillus sp. N1-5-1-14]|uniref:ROK family transcriptional regulator n=1 Tax=Paenibacillus radicibacter TaxID=2972488 RepID=UPI0021599D70|nr:ROK family transcriptional regulator [Paenibacillus radicibacter]MCR8644005.1 ROK family transcriptional regulator [Paenibacillus radicibacter]